MINVLTYSTLINMVYVVRLFQAQNFDVCKETIISLYAVDVVNSPTEIQCSGIDSIGTEFYLFFFTFKMN